MPDGGARRTHPADEALWVPQGVESRDVALQNGLAAALATRREQSEEAMLAILLAFPVMEPCTRDTLRVTLSFSSHCKLSSNTHFSNDIQFYIYLSKYISL